MYGVNVLLAHNDEDGSPVIFETTPTYTNLFGTIQRSYDSRGGWNSDFMDLRAGSMLRADGGFLVMYALDALTEAGVWRTLKRMLNHGKLEIQPLEMFFPFGTSALKPEPIEIDVKIILIGDRHMYEMLYEYEEDFRKIFKVRVEFDEEMVMSDAVVRPVRRTPAPAFRSRKASARSIAPPSPRMLEYGVRAGRTPQQGDGAISGTGGPGARSRLHRAAGRRIAGERRPRVGAPAKRASSGTT